MEKRDKKLKSQAKPLPTDAMVKGPNKLVPLAKLPSDCAG
jgi:hypothetical protein